MATTIIPGPSDQELLGKIGKIQSNALDFLLDLSHTYGPVAGFKVFRTPVIVFSHPDAVKHILQDENKRYSKDTIQYNALSTITGRGLLTNDGASWLRQRRLAQPAFARPRTHAIDGIVVPATQRMLQRWEALSQTGALLDVDAEMMRLTLEVVGKALFSIDLSEEAGELTRAVLTTLDHIVHRARNVIVPPLWFPTPRNLRFRRAMTILDTAVARIIQSRKQTGQLGDDLLGMFLQARDEET
ncbi:MAG: cytochrome P450, partial [Anaerolineae bacterium]|nr:cytochrome P450 [Anaerolineae bacterium]